MVKFIGLVWETGNSLVITLPKKQTGLNKGDSVMINVEKIGEDVNDNNKEYTYNDKKRTMDQSTIK